MFSKFLFVVFFAGLMSLTSCTTKPTHDALTPKILLDHDLEAKAHADAANAAAKHADKSAHKKTTKHKSKAKRKHK